MALLKDIYPYVKPYASGVPEVAIDTEAVALAKELAQKTLLLRDTIYENSQTNWGSYALEIPDDRMLDVVTMVCVNGIKITALPEKPCDGCYANGFWVDRNKTINIYPPPAYGLTDGIEFEYAYSPRFSSCEIDADFLERFGYHIAKGVLSRLLMMKDQKWYNPQLAAKYEKDWQSAMTSALVDGSTPYTRAYISLQSGGSYLNS